jgi:two-component system LytT family sensor kinase
MVETAPGAGMKVTLRVPKFANGVRPDMPDYSSETSEDDAEAPSGPSSVDGTPSGALHGG